MKITDKDRQEIAAAISSAETMTSGEIFCVIAQRSDDYSYIPALWAALVALLLPAPLIYWTGWSLLMIYAAQLACFILLCALFLWWPLRIRMVPGSVRKKRAHRNCMEQFLAHGLHVTESRTGVLIFVSAAERYAEVLADQAIYDKVGADVWDKAVAALIDSVRRGLPAQGFVAAIAMCGEVLAEHFPPDALNHDELPNQLVEL